MTKPYRRSVITGGLAVIAGGAISSVGIGDESGADSSGSGTDVEGSDDDDRSDDESTDEAGSETGEGGPDAAASALELSVSLPESTSDRQAEFLITVVNCGEEAVSTAIDLEVGCLEDELEMPTLAPGESADTYASYAGTRLGRGTHEWTVAVGTACERGTLSVA